MEVDTEVKHLSVVFEPLRCYTGDSVVNLFWALSTLKGGGTLALHGGEELIVDGLLQVSCLFCDDAVSEAHNLGLVVAGERGVRVGHAREEGQVLWNVCLSHLLDFFFKL